MEVLPEVGERDKCGDCVLKMSFSSSRTTGERAAWHHCFTRAMKDGARTCAGARRSINPMPSRQRCSMGSAVPVLSGTHGSQGTGDWRVALALLMSLCML